jgi:predicted phosphoribosyltransferase
VAAFALLLTSVGAGIGIVVEDGEAASFGVNVQSVEPAGSTLSSGGQHSPAIEQVSFVVDNEGMSAANPQCTVEVFDKGAVVGATSMPGDSSLRAGHATHLTVPVPITGPAFVGGAGAARVVCY